MRHDVADIAQSLDRIADRRGDSKSRMQFRRQYLIIQIAHIGVGLEASPNDIGFRNAHGQLCFMVGRFSDAISDWDKLLTINPCEEQAWMQAAAAHPYLGDEAGYRQICQRMLDRAAGTSNPGVRDRTAKACLLATEAVKDLTPVLAMARANIAKGAPTDLPALYHLCAGMAEYRAGNFSAAAKLFQHPLDLSILRSLRRFAQSVHALDSR